MAIPVIRQIDRACRSSENRALSDGRESSGIVLECAGKRPLWSKKWTILGILSVMEMLRQLALATRCETRHFEKTALRFACPELQIVLSVSLNALPRGVFEVIEDDITGNRLFA
jgi:hypothetical protein